jgi:hypothetical protein
MQRKEIEFSLSFLYFSSNLLPRRAHSKECVLPLLKREALLIHNKRMEHKWKIQ